MPIRPDLRHLYSGPAWRAVRERILDRAKNKCEQCGKPNGELVEVVSVHQLICQDAWVRVQFWRGAGTPWIGCIDGVALPRWFRRHSFGVTPRSIRVVLTIAHLNHIAGDDRDENLLALCQWCHLNYDQLHHRETRATRKDAARPIQWTGGISL